MGRNRTTPAVLVMTAVFVAGAIATPVAAVDDLSLNVVAGSEAVVPGDTVTVTLDVANLSAPINGVQALIQYDDALLALVGVVPTDLMLTLPAEGWVEVNLSDDLGDMTYAAVINGDSTIGDGTVATLTFQAIGEGITNVIFRTGSDPRFSKLTVASDNSAISPVTTGSGAIDISCDDGVFCDGLETLVGGVCVSPGDPCTPLLCDEINDVCLAPVRVDNLEVFYAGRYGICAGGPDDGLYCSDDNACRDDPPPSPAAFCDLSGPLADTSRSFLASGSTATIDNVINYVRGITGIRVFFDNIVAFATTPEAAFTYEWSMTPVCVGGGRDGLICDPDNPADQCVVQGGTCEVFFSPVTDAATAISVTSTVQGAATVVSIVIDDNHVRTRWLKVTIDATQVTSTGVELDGELLGNPVVLPSGDGTPGGDAVFFLGNAPGDADGNRKTELTDPGLIRNCSCFTPFFRVPITEPFDVDKDVWVRLGDPGAARAVVNPFVKLPLITP